MFLVTLDLLRQDSREMISSVIAQKSAPIEVDYLGPVIFSPEASIELFRQLLPKEISANPQGHEGPARVLVYAGADVHIRIPTGKTMDGKYDLFNAVDLVPYYCKSPDQQAIQQIAEQARTRTPPSLAIIGKI